MENTLHSATRSPTTCCCLFSVTFRRCCTKSSCFDRPVSCRKRSPTSVSSSCTKISAPRYVIWSF